LYKLEFYSENNHNVLAEIFSISHLFNLHFVFHNFSVYPSNMELQEGKNRISILVSEKLVGLFGAWSIETLLQFL